MEKAETVFYAEFDPVDLGLNVLDKDFKQQAYKKLCESSSMQSHNWYQIQRLPSSHESWFIKCCQITINNFNVKYKV